MSNTAAQQTGEAGSELRDAREALVREHIMAAAERVFADEGFASTKMQVIAQAAGVSLTTLYQAFSGKEALYRAVLVSRDEQMLDAVASPGRALVEQEGSIAGLLRLLGVQLQFLLSHPDYLKMQLQEGRAWYDSAARPSADQQRLWERGVAQMAQVFAWGERERLFIPGEHEDQARLMLALQQARLAGWVAGGMREPHESVIARIQADFVRHFCRPSVAAELLTEDGASLVQRFARPIPSPRERGEG